MASKRPLGSEPLPIHSIRVPAEIWGPAKERARQEDETMTAIICLFLSWYARGGARPEPNSIAVDGLPGEVPA